MIVYTLVASFAVLSTGCLLLGIAAVKDAWTPVKVERVEIGDRAVETRTRA